MKPNRLAFVVLLMVLLAVAHAHAIRPERPAADALTSAEYLTEAELLWLKNHPVIRVGGPRAFPPFHFYEGGTAARGISADYIAHLAHDLGLKTEITGDLPWPDVLDGARNGRIDLIACIAKTTDREAYLRYTAPYLSFPLVIMTRKESPFIADIHDLRGKTLACIRNASTYAWLRRDGISIHPLFVNTPLDALKAVSTGRADAHIGNLAANAYLIETHGLTNLKVAAPTPYENYDLHFAVRFDWPELAAILDKALARMDAADHAAIRNRWLSIRYEHGFSMTDLLEWVLGVAGVSSIWIIALFVWNRRLLREIRERTRAEDLLTRSEARFSLFLEGAADAVAILQDDRIIYRNPAFESLMGDPSGERGFFDLAAPEDRNRVRDAHHRFMAGAEGPTQYEMAVVGRNGERISMEVRISTVDYQDGKAVMAIMRDLNERRKAEDALRESEENYRQLVELSPDMIVVHKAGVIRFINTAGLKMMRAKRRDQIVGKNVVSFVSESYKAVAMERMRSHDQRIGKATPLYDQRLVRLDGEEFDVDLVGIPFYYKGELITQLIIRDISNRKAADRERKRLEDQLRQSQKMEAVGTLASGIAHDFNNVLGIILSNVELALPLAETENPLRKRLDRIRTAGLRARDIIRQLLGFTRKTEITRRPTRWSPILKESIKLIRATLPASIEIRHRLAAASDVLLADPTQLHQVIINLCTNAGHAMKDGGVLDISLATVHLDADDVKRLHGLSPGPYLELIVADTGNGIDPAIQDRIFDPYFTTKGIGEGTGMGLSVVHQIVRDCAGAVSVESDPGHGTRFRLLFPAAEDVSAEVPDEPSAADRPFGGGERILLIDDETLITEAMGEILKALGYAVEVQNDPLAALELFSAAPNRFDLLITDMNMPGMTGDRLARAARAIRIDIPVILCTGDSSGLGVNDGDAPDISACLTKPVTMKRIAAAIREVLPDGSG